MRALVCMIAAVASAACAAPSPARPSATPSSTGSSEGSLFRFHVDFWANLNQVMLHESLLPRPGYEGPKSLKNHHVVSADTLGPTDAAHWRQALGYYDTHFTTRNLFDHFTNAMPALLGVGPSETPPTTPDLDEEWQSHLRLAAPVYRDHFWPEHARKDQAYIDGMRPLIAAHEAWFAKRLVGVYGMPLPAGPIDVDVTPVVPPFGGFTQGEPPYTGPNAALITLSSEDPTYATSAGVEMLFHEVSHLLAGHLIDKLEASAKRQDRKLPRKFWHDVIFYTAGHLAQERLGPTYVPYAERPMSLLFEGETDPTLIVLKRSWQPYLDGRTTMDAAVDAMVAGF